MITSEDLESADEMYRTIGKALGRESTMRDLHTAVCRAAGVEYEAGANYVHRIVSMLGEKMGLTNDGMDMVAVVVRHAMCVGVTAAKKEALRTS